jgi:hypothetical protein
MILHLGVTDLPYGYAKDGKTTGDVAEILEAKYEIFQHFTQQHEAEILKAIDNSVVGSFESMMSGAPPNDIYGTGTNEIEELFRTFLSGREMEGLGIAGVPTKAALAGVNHRLKRPYKKRAPRPSFIDTGLFESSMRAWIDEQ